MNDLWPVVITIHAISASLALIVGAYQLLRPVKGDAIHRIIGRFWAGSMYVVTVSSFGIQTLTGSFSWLHVLSALTFITVTIGIVAAAKGHIKAHKSYMQGSYYGLLGAFVGVITVPTRRIPQMAMFDLPSFVAWAAILLVVSVSVIGTAQLLHKRQA